MYKVTFLSDQSFLHLYHIVAYTNWSPWKACSKSCGFGKKIRIRECKYTGKKKHLCKKATDTLHKQDCNSFHCPGETIYVT